MRPHYQIAFGGGKLSVVISPLSVGSTARYTCAASGSEQLTSDNGLMTNDKIIDSRWNLAILNIVKRKDAVKQLRDDIERQARARKRSFAAGNT
jgi:hypothetical protein